MSDIISPIEIIHPKFTFSKINVKKDHIIIEDINGIFHRISSKYNMESYFVDSLKIFFGKYGPDDTRRLLLKYTSDLHDIELIINWLDINVEIDIIN